MIETTIIRENALTDDVVHVAPAGKIFRGGNVAVLEYYTYANEWGDHKHYRGFKTLDNMHKYINRNYKDFNGEVLGA